MLVTVSNLFTDIIPAGTSFSFALLNIPAPPTKQPLDAIVVTSQIGGSSIDTGNAYV